MITFENVTKRYPKATAIESVSFRIENKELAFIVGPSGAGKTTIFRLLIANERPTFGEIRYNGVQYSRMKRSEKVRVRRNIGVIFQDYKILPTRTVRENVAFVLEITGQSDAKIKKDTEHVLSLVGLTDRANHFPAELSGGELQRAGIARALAQNPDVILADEPTANIDDELQASIMQTLKDINSLGKTVVVATHRKHFAETFGNHVLVMNRGKLIDDYIPQTNR